MTNRTWLANIFDWLGETFERFNPAAFRFLAAVLPYMTPYPVAWLTMRSAESFLGFTPSVAFAFVFGLEGMGLWFTSLFVDAVIDWIKSRNVKTFALVAMFGLVVAAYVYLLVNLNVTLKASTGVSEPALERVITLLCFLPLLTGVGNGYYKWKLEAKREMGKKETEAASLEEKRHQEAVETEERRHQEQVQAEALRLKLANEAKVKRQMIKAGMNPLAVQYQSVVETPVAVEPPPKTGDWRLLNSSQRKRVKYDLTISEIIKEFGVSRATAYNWRDDPKYIV